MARSTLVLVGFLAMLVLASSASVEKKRRSAKPLVKNAVECTTYPCLIFEDNFDSLDLDVWQHEISLSGGGNWEFQYYTNNRTNSYTKDGKLFIKPTLASDKYGEAFLTSGEINLWGGTPASQCTNNGYWGCARTGTPDNVLNPIQSARLRSVHSFNFRYGRAEISARLPTGDWIWPAIWMMSKKENYGGWPASGEIDIMESRGNADLRDETGVQKGVFEASSTMHWGPYWPYNGFEKTTGARHNNYGQTFHDYVLEWDPNSIRLSIDGDVVVNVSPPAGGFWELGNFGLPADNNPWRYSNSRMAPFDTEFYFILNVAVGGTNGYFPDGWTNANYPKPWSNNGAFAFRDFWNARNNWYPTWNPQASEGENAAMQIDYIRVWKQGPDPAEYVDE